MSTRGLPLVGELVRSQVVLLLDLWHPDAGLDGTAVAAVLLPLAVGGGSCALVEEKRHGSVVFTDG